MTAKPILTILIFLLCCLISSGIRGIWGAFFLLRLLHGCLLFFSKTFQPWFSRICRISCYLPSCASYIKLMRS